MRSKHLPQPPHGLSLAVDCAPTEYLTHKSWVPRGKHWQTLGDLAHQVGLKWGGDWVSFYDAPHLELPACLCPTGEAA